LTTATPPRRRLVAKTDVPEHYDWLTAERVQYLQRTGILKPIRLVPKKGARVFYDRDQIEALGTELGRGPGSPSALPLSDGPTVGRNESHCQEDHQHAWRGEGRRVRSEGTEEREEGAQRQHEGTPNDCL